MSTKKKRKGPGIRTFADLKDRCRIEGKCWVWCGALTQSRCPAAWSPVLGKTTTLGSLICAIKTGAATPKDKRWHAVCGTRFCANPAHFVEGTASSVGKAAGLKHTPLSIAKITKARRKRSKLSDAAVESIRNSTDTIKATAMLHNISHSHVFRIRGMRSRKPIGGLFNGLLAA